MTNAPSTIPYHCPNQYCSAVSYIMDQETSDGETWCAISCSLTHVYVSKLSDLQEVTNLYWPTKGQQSKPV